MGYMREAYNKMPDWNQKKNDLTWRLFDEGCTPDNHPNNVRWVDHKYEFEYTLKWLISSIWESPCGLLKNGINSHHEMGYMGIDWQPENNNPVFRCPLKNINCEQNHELLIGHKCQGVVDCAFRLTDKPHDYEKSIERINDEKEAYKKRLYDDLLQRLRGHLCYHHAHWDDDNNLWSQKYDPSNCISAFCNKSICVLTRKVIETKKGNVFFDLKITRYLHDGSLWDGEKTANIIKGKKVFNSPLSITICEAYARFNQEDILEKEKMKMHGELFLNPDTEIEILRARAEIRESRNLLQDLQDVQEGLNVKHDSDLKKATKEVKSERLKKAKEKRNKPENVFKKITSHVGKEKIQEVRRLAKIGKKSTEIVQKVGISKNYIDKIMGIVAEERVKKIEQISLF